ncbi:MAG: polysaccharide deacetylase family protein [Steroidobacteraceae bacterium]|nr:polysaccharide deacetylase family protein [Steroidobacteraceae bacterium]
MEVAAGVLDSLGLLNGVLRIARGRYIMAYHRVLPPAEAQAEWCHPAIWIRPKTLDEHLGFFSDIGRLVPLHELLEADDADGPLFAITFDDAWIDNLTYAIPVLDAHGAKATFFVPTDAVSTGRLFWTEELALKIGAALLGPRGEALIAHFGWPPETCGQGNALLPRLMEFIEQLKELPLAEREHSIERLYAQFGIPTSPVQGRVMTWDQIRSLSAQGHTIGSHSKTHLILRNVDVARVDEELVESRRIVEEQIGRPVDCFCFPNARYDAVSSERVLAAGYRYGFRIHNLKVTRTTHRALIPRFSASEANATLPFLKLRFARACLT